MIIGHDIRNSAGKLGPGLDIRANGGYVIVAPSEVINRNGQFGRYEWLTEITLTNGELPQVEDWLMQWLIENSSAPKKAVADLCNSAGRVYGQKALEEECGRIAGASLGTRNDTLNKSAFGIFQLVSGGVLPAEEAEARLYEAAQFSGLDDKEIRATINSARSKAALSPRSLPESTYSKILSRDRPRLTVSPSPAAPLDVFPAKIQKMLKEAAVAFEQLPIEVPIVTLLGMLTACLGQSRLLQVKDNWEEAGNLYLALVAISGLGKSPCFKAFLNAVWKAEVKNKEQWDEEMASYNAIMEERRLRKDRQNLPDPPPKPVRTQYIIEDGTTGAIGAILAENPMGFLWYSDELSSILLNLDRYTGNKGGTKARLLSTYDRSPWKTSRRDHEKEQVIASAALSIVGTVQPKVLNELFGQADAFSGFLPRFIFILAKREAPALLTNDIFTGQEILEKICAYLLAWHKNQSEPRKVKISPEAYSLYEDWYNRVMREAWRESEIDNAIAAKLVTQVLRLALLLHSFKAALDENDGLHDLNAETMSGAIALGWWIREHQRRIWKSLDNLHNGDRVNFQKTINKRIDKLNLKRAPRHDAVHMCGIIVSSNLEFFQNLDAAEQKRFFQSAKNWLEDFVGPENMIAANVHMDEKTPHLHFCHVPVTLDGRLCAKDIYTRSSLKRMQSELPKYLQSLGFGIERGVIQESGSAKKHLDTREFKQQQVALEKMGQESELESAKLENLKKTISGYEKLAAEAEKILAEKPELPSPGMFKA